MKQIKNWTAIVILICIASAFTSCTSKEDNPVTPKTGVVEKMLGVWMCVEIESGISPNTHEPYNKIVSSYNITPDGIGFYDEVYMKDDVAVDMTSDRHIDGCFRYREDGDMLFCTNITTNEQGYLKYENDCIVDLFEKDRIFVYTRCTPEEEQFVRRAGLYGMWRNIYEETGKTPNQELPYDKHIETYCFNSDGTGFFESLYFNGELLVETECDRTSNGKFAYEWVNDTDITCTDFEEGKQWKVTYERGIFTDYEDPEEPITYTKVKFDKCL